MSDSDGTFLVSTSNASTVDFLPQRFARCHSKRRFCDVQKQIKHLHWENCPAGVSNASRWEMTHMKIDRRNQCAPAHRGLYQIFIKDGVNEGEDLELDELNNSGCSQRQRQQPQGALGDTPATSHQMLMPNRANVSPTSTPPTPPEDGQKSEKNGDTTQEGLTEPAPVVALRNGKTQTSLKTMSRRKISQQKEKKATQMLAIVLGERRFHWLHLQALQTISPASYQFSI